MNLLDDLIYAYEIGSVDDLTDLYYSDVLPQEDIVKVSRYLVNNLREHHTVNGNIWMTLCGIINWYDKKQFMTDAQAIYLIANTKKHLQERSVA